MGSHLTEIPVAENEIAHVFPSSVGGLHSLKVADTAGRGAVYLQAKTTAPKVFLPTPSLFSHYHPGFKTYHFRCKSNVKGEEAAGSLTLNVNIIQYSSDVYFTWNGPDIHSYLQWLITSIIRYDNCREQTDIIQNPQKMTVSISVMPGWLSPY